MGWAFLANLDANHPDLGIAVAELMPDKGLGKSLLSQLLGWASKRGILKIYLMVVMDNHRAIRLYESHGFVTYDEEFDEVDQFSYGG